MYIQIITGNLNTAIKACDEARAIILRDRFLQAVEYLHDDANYVNVT